MDWKPEGAIPIEEAKTWQPQGAVAIEESPPQSAIIHPQSAIDSATQADDVFATAEQTGLPLGILDETYPNAKPEIDHFKDKGPIGLREQIERMDGVDWLQLTPFVGSVSSAIESGELAAAAMRLKKNEYAGAKSKLAGEALRIGGEVKQATGGEMPFGVSQRSLAASIPDEQMRQGDISLLERFLLDREERAVRGQAFGAKVFAGVSYMPSWMIEFALTGGLAKLGSKAAQDIGVRTLRGYAETVGGRAVLKAAGWTGAQISRTTLGMAPRIAEDIAQRRLSSLQLQNGQVIDVNPESWATSIAKGYENQLIQVSTETMGSSIGKFLVKPVEGAAVRGVTWISRKSLAKMPFAQGLYDGMKAMYLRMHPEEGALAQFTDKFFNAAKWDGLVEEMGEERMATILSSLAETQNFTNEPDPNPLENLKAGILQDLKPGNLLAEAAVLSIPGALSTAAHLVGPRREAPNVPQAESQIPSSENRGPVPGPAEALPSSVVPVAARSEAAAQATVKENLIVQRSKGLPGVAQMTEPGAAKGESDISNLKSQISTPAPTASGRMSFTSEPGQPGTVWGDALQAAEQEAQANLQTKLRNILVNRKPEELRQMAKDLGVTRKRGEGLAIPLSETLADRSRTPPPSVLGGETHPGSWTYQQFMERYGQELAENSPWVKRYSLDRAETPKNMYRRLQDEYKVLKAHQVLADLLINDKSWKPPELMTEGQRDRRLSEVNAAIQASPQYQERIASLQAMPLPHSTFYVDPKYKGEVESVIGKPGQPGYNFRVGQYITYSMPKDRKTIMHWDDTAQEMGLGDLPFDKFLEYLDAATQKGSVTKVSQNILDDLLAGQSKDPYLSGLAMHRDMLQRGFNHNEIREAIQKDLTMDAEYYGLTPADIPDILKAVLLEQPNEQTGGRVPQRVSGQETASDLAGGEPDIDTGGFNDFSEPETRAILADASDAAKRQESNEFWGVEPPKDLTPEGTDPAPEQIGFVRNCLEVLKLGKLTDKDIDEFITFWQFPEDLRQSHPTFDPTYRVQNGRETDHAVLQRTIAESFQPYLDMTDAEREAVDLALVQTEHDLGAEPPISRLNDKQREGYKAYRKTFDDCGEMLVAWMKRIGVPQDQIDELSSRIGNYVPHTWYGSWRVIVMEDADRAKSLNRPQQVEWQAGVDKWDVPRMQATLQARYPGQEIKVFPATKLPYEAFQEANFAAVSEMVKIVIETARKKMTDAQLEGADELLQSLQQAQRDVYKAKGQAMHFIHRKDTPGWTQDLRKPSVEYLGGFAGFLTKMEACLAFADAIKAIKPNQTPKLYNYALRYIDYVTGQAPESITSLKHEFQTLRTVTYYWNLFGSPVKGVVNLTGNFIMGWPTLSKYTHWSLARMFLAQAKTATGQLDETHHAILNALEEKGLFESQMSQEMSGFGGNALYRAALGTGKKAASWLDYMRMTERFNRRSMAVALIDAGYDSIDDANLAEIARIVEEAHHRYSKGNRPESFRGFLAPLMQFKSYTFHQFTWYKNEIKAGRISPVLRSLAAWVVIGGAGSMLGRLGRQLWTKVFGDDPDEEAKKLFADTAEKVGLSRATGRTVAKVIMRGIPSLWGGTLAPSIQMIDILPTVEPGQDWKIAIGEWALGPVADIPARAGRMAQDLRTRQYLRALEDGAPAGLRNPLAAWRLYSVGMQNRRGQDILDADTQVPLKLSRWEALVKGLGMASDRMARSYEIDQFLKDVGTARQSSLSNWADRWTLAQQDGDKEALTQIGQEINAYNSKMARDKSTQGITVADWKRALSLRQKPANQLSESERKLYVEFFGFPAARRESK